jgi:hypothetical protein
MHLKKLLLAVLVLSLPSVVARADNFSFTGNINSVDEVQLFTFTVRANSNVALRTWSYAGGVNAAGQTIARGGFDPILALFQGTGPSAVYISQNDDGGCGNVAADAVSGECWDTYLAVSNLTAGDYTVSVMDYANFAFGPTLGDGFENSGTPDSYCGGGPFCDVTGHPRDSHWAFDILGVEAATNPTGTSEPPQATAPEPSSLALLGTGIVGVVNLARRRFAA